jgi:hypothetical protein
VHGMDRKGMNALRRDTQEFRKFLSGLMKIKDYAFTDEELNEVSIKDNGSLALNSLWRHDAKVITERHTKFNEMVKSGDAENWHSAAMWLCASARYSMWDRKFDPRKVTALLDDILIALNPTVLVPRQLEVGAIKVDAYARFKPFMEEHCKNG